MGRQTALYGKHVAAGGRMVDFSGYELPVQYASIKGEHEAVRERAGLFDVSHMGEIFFEGPEALASLNRLVTNDLRQCADGQAQYNTICRPDGGIIDDTVIYRFSDERLLVCVNAGNRDKDFAWLAARARGNAQVKQESDDWAQVALQGPKALAILQRVTNIDAHSMAPFRFVEAEVAGVAGIVARTGYTGEDGVEIFCRTADASGLWDVLLDTGTSDGLLPCGLGARDSLRLEVKYCLYGNDIDETTTPLEAGLGWVVKLDKPEFIGQEALVNQKRDGVKRRLVGFEVTGRGIARHGHPVLVNGEAVGEVTSGTMSPTLGKAIGLAYVPFEHRRSGTELHVEIRGRSVPITVVKTPFYKRS